MSVDDRTGAVDMIPLYDMEKRIKHLSQQELLTESVGTLIELLLKKGIVTIEELQDKLLERIEQLEE